jgi:hypothetical protein
VGWSTLARNGVVGTVAAFVALDGRLAWLIALVAAVGFTLWVAPR